MELSKLILTIVEGEPMASVQTKLGLKSAPELDDEDPRGTTFYHFADLGAWVFFTGEGQVKSIRFNAPFALAVDGVCIGNTRDEVMKVRGRPDRFHPIDDKERWIYYGPPFLRVDFDPASNRVDKIFR
jgi:hypothetical protein